MGRLDRMVCGAFFQLNIIGFEDSEGKPRLSTHLSKTRLAYETQRWNEMTFKLRRFWNPKGSSRTFNLNQIISLIRTLSPWEVNESTQRSTTGQLQSWPRAQAPNQYSAFLPLTSPVISSFRLALLFLSLLSVWNLFHSNHNCSYPVDVTLFDSERR